MFYPLDQSEWRQPLQLYKICPKTLIWASSQSKLLEYLGGCMKSIYTKLALYSINNECVRTEVRDGTVSLKLNGVGPVDNRPSTHKKTRNMWCVTCDMWHVILTVWRWLKNNLGYNGFCVELAGNFRRHRDAKYMGRCLSRVFWLLLVAGEISFYQYFGLLAK